MRQYTARFIPLHRRGIELSYNEPCVIRDAQGNIIQRSRNLAGIRRYVSNHAIAVIAIDRIGEIHKHPTSGRVYSEGKLMILFRDRSSYETNFSCFSVLANIVRNWRNVYGAPIRVMGTNTGTVSYSNPTLKELAR